MHTKLTLFTATLVQDSALSVSGLDREASADQPFAIVDGVPTLPGRGLKGAAVAMAKRFFQSLPRCISADVGESALRRSAWEFADARTGGEPQVRTGVGIRQRTGARAGGVLYQREVIPAGTRWELSFRVDRSHTLDDEEFSEAEGILGYVLAEHWAKGRCWLGGGAARGLGWCHLESLRAYRFNADAYEAWVKTGRVTLPSPLETVPVVGPTRSWCFRTLDVNVSFGEYRPEPSEAAWGVDMFTVGSHETERTSQATGGGHWAKPAWAMARGTPDSFSTDRSLLMERGRPLLPGASMRGPLRHAYSRMKRAEGCDIQDPHEVQGDVGPDDAAGKAFGTVGKSSRILIRDACAEGEWAAAKLHMHAEDEFSAGSYGSAKRDAVRLLRGTFPVRIVVEGGDVSEVEELVTVVYRQVALGALGHLPIGGHKTRGASFGRWEAKPWVNDDVIAVRTHEGPTGLPQSVADPGRSTPSLIEPPCNSEALVRTETGELAEPLTLGLASKLAKAALGETLVAWWCEPTIDIGLSKPPTTFGTSWPAEEAQLHVDEIAFFAQRAVWRAARTSRGNRFALIEELDANSDKTMRATVLHTPARLHAFRRFGSAETGQGNVLLREWHVDGDILGFTIAREVR